MFALREFVLAVAAASIALATPPLSLIQDTIYRADGTRFNGVAVIEWKSYQASDASAIAADRLTIRILNGAIRVQLVPTTDASPGAVYKVVFTDGSTQFTENWGVPPSNSPLRLRDVRLGGAGSVVSPPADTQITISNVSGLTEELSARPSKAAGYAPSRTAFINSLGSIEGVAGNLSDCVRVDGSSGPCGAPAGGQSIVDAETPAGVVDGANPAFALSNSPYPASSLALYRNGILQKQAVDYTLAANSIHFLALSIPQDGDVLTASYRLDGLPAGVPTSTVPQVICSGMGISTNGTTAATLGSCTIPVALLSAGDRYDVRFDYSHEGAAVGFTFEVRWGNTLLISRSAPSTETVAGGRFDSAIQSSGARTSSQTWGGALPVASSAVLAVDSLSSPIPIVFSGRMASSTSDTVTLRSFTVVRYPAHVQQ